MAEIEPARHVLVWGAGDGHGGGGEGVECEKAPELDGRADDGAGVGLGADFRKRVEIGFPAHPVRAVMGRVDLFECVLGRDDDEHFDTGLADPLDERA